MCPEFPALTFKGGETTVLQINEFKHYHYEKQVSIVFLSYFTSEKYLTKANILNHNLQ